MIGIENLTDQILKEAQQHAEAILLDAREKAAGIEAEAVEKGKKAAEKYAAAAEHDVKDAADRTESQAGLRRRQALLTAKQGIISSAIEKAYEKLVGQDDASYFAMIEKMLAKTAGKEDGEIFFSAKDLKRLPEGFAGTIEKIAAAAGGSLKVSDQAANIDSGFILRCGGVDENCSLKALFDEKQNELQDEVHRTLW